MSSSEEPSTPSRHKYQIVEDLDELPARMKLLLDTLIKFYRNGTFESVVLPIMQHKEPLALRDIDWLVTNYSLAFPVVYPNPINPHGEPFNLHDSYEQHEEAWKKKLFDPFARGPRILFSDGHGKQYETTIAQLNFFRWAIQYGVIDYASQHREAIRKHHYDTKLERKKLIQSTPNREKKRMRLTQTDKARCLVYVQPMRISMTGPEKKPPQ